MQIATHSSHAIWPDSLAFCYSMRQVDPDCFSASKYLEYLVARKKIYTTDNSIGIDKH